MNSLSRTSRILYCVLLVAVVFLSIQIIIYQFVFNQLANEASSTVKEHLFRVRGRTIFVYEQPTSTKPLVPTRKQTFLTFQSDLATKITNVVKSNSRERIFQYQLDLDDKNKPMVGVCLPFFNILNHKFNKTYVMDPHIESNSKDAVDPPIRGVHSKYLALYRPDSDRLFKCINSNVS